MADKGVFYYKLKSPYPYDKTRDCKLTITEMDENFFNLRSEDIKDITVDREEKGIVVERYDGEKMILELSEINPDLDVVYNDVDGVIEITYDGKEYPAITGLITKANLSKEILTKVYSDNTLTGLGTANSPLMISPMMRTSFYRPVKRLVDMTHGERVPEKYVEKGDRYVVLETVSDYGLLYDFNGAEYVNKMLYKTGWRVPSKADWDNMLNAIEPCEFRNHNLTKTECVLGKMAGTLLKSQDEWSCGFEHDHFHDGHHHDFEHPHKERLFDEDERRFKDDEFDVDFKGCRPEPCHKPMPKPIPENGVDAYGMGVLPAGFAYFSRPMQFVHFGSQGAFWTTDKTPTDNIYAKVFTKKDSGVLQVGERPSVFLSIRLIKDYDGNNHNDVENILGHNYKTVLMPSLDNPNGYAIWTAQNINISDKCIHAIEPNEGVGVRNRKIYFIYEWNGFDWDKIEMVEGDSVTIMEGKRPNEVYRIIKGKLSNVDDAVIKIIRGEVMKDITDIKFKMDEMTDVINEHSDKIKDIETKLEEASEKENGMQEALDSLTEDVNTNKENIEELQTNLKDLSDKTDEIEDNLNTEIEDRKEAESKLTEKTEELQLEIDTTNEKVTEIEEKVTDIEGKTVVEGEYDVETGTLTLKTANEDNTIEIKLSNDYGTFDFTFCKQ